MRFSIFIKATIPLLILLVACQTQTPTASLAPTATSTITPSPTPMPDPEIISPENASQLTLKWMNMGASIGGPMYSSDGKWVYVESTVGTYAFDTVSYQDVHSLESKPAEMLSPTDRTFPKLEPLPEEADQSNAQQPIFSPDGSLMAQYFSPKTAAVWNLADGKLIHTFDGPPQEISPDNRLITIGRSVPHEPYDELYVDLYDLQTGEQLGSWHSMRAAFLSDGTLAVESGGYTRIFDPQTRKVPHAFPGEFAAFSPDEQIMAVLYGNRIHVYRVPDDKLLHNLDSGLSNPGDAIFRFSANGGILAGYTIEYYCCTGYSSHLFVWDLTDGRLLADLSRSGELLPLYFPSFSLSPDGQTILRGLEVRRTSDGALVTDLGMYFTRAVTNLAFTPNGQKIIVRDTRGEMSLYRVGGGFLEPAQAADPKAYLPILQTAVPNPYPDDAIYVLSPDGKFSARRNLGVVTFWNTSGEGESYMIPLYHVTRLTFSPNGRILALGSQAGTVELWDTINKQKIHTILPNTSDNLYAVVGLAFSPDEKLLAIGLEDGTVRLFGINLQK